MRTNRNQGFTLMELLIVVAIIGVLVSVAIPIFNKQLEKTRESVDIASMRNAYALAAVAILEDGEVDGVKFSTFSSSAPAYYDSRGILTASAPQAYGKGRRVSGGTTYGACADYRYDPSVDYTKGVITVWAEKDIPHVHWSVEGGSTGGTTGDTTEEIGNNATDLPESLGEGEKVRVVAGNVYRYNGKLYIATNTENFNQWSYRKPEGENSGYLYIQPTGKTLSNSDLDSDGRLTVKVSVGDIYKDGTSIYIRKVDSDAFQSVEPSKDSQNWLKINTKSGS